MENNNSQLNTGARMSEEQGKLALPATEVFYQRAMERSAEIRTSVQLETNARPDNTETTQ